MKSRLLTFHASMVACLAGWCVALPHAQAADVDPFSYAETFANFGQQPNLCPASNPKGICAAVASINSFIFLEKQYPTIYGEKLTPNLTGNTDSKDATDFGVNGWKVGDNPQRVGYYDASVSTYGGYLDTKKNWINDHAPGTTTFEARYSGAGGPPDLSWLSTQISKGQDVEFFVQGTDFFHAMTLTGVACTGKNFASCSINYQDPNAPATNRTAAVSSTKDGLQFTDIPSSSFKGVVTITGAFAESPVPEPQGYALLASGVLTLAWVARHRRRDES